jgi:hypothetical protein
MDASPYQRLETFWQSKGLKNMSAFAEAIQLSPGTISAIKQRGSRPSNVVMRAIQSAFPDVSPEWVLWGTGPMLKDGRSLVPVATPVDEPAAPFAPTAPVIANPDVVTAFLGQMAEMTRAHREEILALKKEARKDLRAQAETYTYTINRMADERARLEQRIFELEGRFGLRPPTAEEMELQARQLPPPSVKVKGLKSYEPEAPTGAEMTLVRGESGFPRLPEFDAESPLRIAA